MMINPLHPIVVHFPIALILIGTLIALCALFIAPRYLSVLAAILLGLGTIGAYAAVQSGGDAYDAFSKKYPEAKTTLNEHAKLADQTLPAAYAVSFIALLSAFLGKKPKAFKIFRIITALSALILSFLLFKTAEHGGLMIYRDVLKISQPQGNGQP